MSLGTFFRDYVYIPLGGNRHNQWRNIIVVWFLTGMWHGASWNFIIWGLYYAFWLIIEKTFLLKLFEKMPKVISFIVTHLYTLFITVFGFVIFYFDKDVLTNIGYLFGIGVSGGTSLFTNSYILGNIILLAAALICSTPLAKALVEWLKSKNALPYPVERILKTLVVVAFIAICTVRLAGNTYSPFIYFRF